MHRFFRRFERIGLTIDVDLSMIPLPRVELELYEETAAWIAFTISTRGCDPVFMVEKTLTVPPWLRELLP